MRIGLDARTLASPIRSGVEHYVTNLARALARIEAEAEIIAYLDQPISNPALVEELESGSLRAKVIPAKRGWLRAALPWRLWRDRIGIVHLPSTIVPPVLPCPAVVTVHDLAWARYPETYDAADLRMQTRAVPRSVRRAARVIAVSQNTARDVAETLRVRPDRITAIPLGVSPLFSPTGPPLPPDAFPGADRARGGCILHSGGLHPRKNVARLLEAYAELRRRTAAPPLLITGDTSSTAAQESTAQAGAMGFGEDVVFCGTIEESALSALYRSARVAVYPSLYEGFGLPILEAMASGVPVVTSNRASMAEVAGDAALLINPEDVGALASALERALTDDALRGDLRARGLARARLFTWEETARATLSVYERVARGD